jgi:orotate phosphoribosyltransferase
MEALMQDRISELRDLLAERSIQHGEFVLVSGAKSNYYCDSKRTLLSPKGARLAGEVLFEILAERDIEAVGGLQLGATFISTAISLVSDQRGRPIYGFTVRDREKQHGTKRLVEESYHPGPEPLLSPGRRVAIVDDVVTKGGSVLKAVDAVREKGCNVEVVVALVDRMAGGGDLLRERGLNYFSLFHTDENGELHVNELPRAADAPQNAPAGALRR